MALEPPTEPELDLVFDDGDNPPIDLQGVTAVFAELPWIYFESQPGTLIARYGNPKAAATADALSPTAILITHAHNDHMGDAVPIAKRTGAIIVSNFEIATFLEQQGEVVAYVGSIVPAAKADAEPMVRFA